MHRVVGRRLSVELYREEIALAMELHNEGCTWRNIAIGLGVNCPDILRDRVRRAANAGREPRPAAIQAQGSRSANMPPAHPRGEGAHADAGALGILALGKTSSHDALRAQASCQS